jgi:hypothetical protein
MADFVMVCELPTIEKIIKQIREIICFIILGLYYKHNNKSSDFKKIFQKFYFKFPIPIIKGG